MSPLAVGRYEVYLLYFLLRDNFKAFSGDNQLLVKIASLAAALLCLPHMEKYSLMVKTDQRVLNSPAAVKSL